MTEFKESDFHKPSEYDNLIDKTHKIVNDQRFGKILLIDLRNSKNDRIFMKEKICNNKIEAQNEILDLRNQLKISNPNILKLIDYSTILKKGFCSSHYIIKSYYEYPDNDLYQEIIYRKKNNLFFQEEELIMILFQISFGLKYLQENNLFHGDIRPKYISCNFNDLKFKIINLYNNVENPLEIQKNHFSQLSSDLYLSPELYNNIINRIKELNFNKYKSETFSLGLVLLEAALLEDIQGLYGNRNKKIIDVEYLNSLISKLEQIYGIESKIFIIINGLLCLIEDERPDLIQLFQGISNLENDNNENYQYYNNMDNYDQNEEINCNYNQNQQNYYKEGVKQIIKNESTNNIDKSNYSNVYVGKVTMYKYILDDNGNKIHIEEPRVIENNYNMEEILSGKNPENCNIKYNINNEINNQNGNEINPENITSEIYMNNKVNINPNHEYYEGYDEIPYNYQSKNLKKNSEKVLKVNKYKIDENGNKIFIEE